VRVRIEPKLSPFSVGNAMLWTHFAKIDMKFRDRTVIPLSCVKLSPPVELLMNVLESSQRVVFTPSEHNWLFNQIRIDLGSDFQH
jgi:hypothetical protein